ncbi:MAG: hypothetical protein LBT03_02000 [Holosporales bacterium]|jgi:hypothetical protein|nr:hypothetical protein [Holosporales bacterium]
MKANRLLGIGIILAILGTGETLATTKFGAGVRGGIAFTKLQKGKYGITGKSDDGSDSVLNPSRVAGDLARNKPCFPAELYFESVWECCDWMVGGSLAIGGTIGKLCKKINNNAAIKGVNTGTTENKVAGIAGEVGTAANTPGNETPITLNGDVTMKQKWNGSVTLIFGHNIAQGHTIALNLGATFAGYRYTFRLHATKVGEADENGEVASKSLSKGRVSCFVGATYDCMINNTVYARLTYRWNLPTGKVSKTVEPTAENQAKTKIEWGEWTSHAVMIGVGMKF